METYTLIEKEISKYYTKYYKFFNSKYELQIKYEDTILTCCGMLKHMFYDTSSSIKTGRFNLIKYIMHTDYAYIIIMYSKILIILKPNDYTHKRYQYPFNKVNVLIDYYLSKENINSEITCSYFQYNDDIIIKDKSYKIYLFMSLLF